MIEEVKQKYTFVIHMTKPENQVIMIPSSNKLTFKRLFRKIRWNIGGMKLSGKDGLNVMISKPRKNISFIIEDRVEAVQATLDKMNEAQKGSNIIRPGFRQFPGKRRG